jgi:hypothetical protein
MTLTLFGTFDGEVLRPNEPVPIPPNTNVKITLEIEGEDLPPPGSFLRTAMDMQLEGPSDWSARLHDYLYGEDLPGAG